MEVWLTWDGFSTFSACRRLREQAFRPREPSGRREIYMPSDCVVVRGVLYIAFWLLAYHERRLIDEFLRGLGPRKRKGLEINAIFFDAAAFVCSIVRRVSYSKLPPSSSWPPSSGIGVIYRRWTSLSICVPTPTNEKRRVAHVY